VAIICCIIDGCCAPIGLTAEGACCWTIGVAGLGAAAAGAAALGAAATGLETGAAL
jgi:hypothetical protein